MVRRGLISLAGLAALLLVLLLVAAAWLLNTSSGTAWLLARLSQSGQLRVEAEIQGSLWSGVALSDLRIDWPGGQLSSDRLQLEWQPARLFSGRLVIDSLEIGSTQLHWDTASESVAEPAAPSEPWQLAELWPQWPGWLLAGAAEVGRFSLAELAFGSRDGTPMILADLSGRLDYASGALRGTALHLRLPCGTWDGELTLDLRRREMAADLLWQGQAFVADWNQVHTRVQLDENLIGRLQAATLADTRERIALSADVALTLDAVTLSKLVAVRSDAADQVSGTLQVLWRDSFRLIGDLKLSGLNLVAEAGWPTALSGSLQGELDSRGYTGRLDLVNTRPGLEQGTLAAMLAGDWQGLRLSEISAGWLEGTLSGGLELGWQEGFQLAGKLRGSGLNPAALVPGMTGKLQLDASGGLRISSTGELTAHWDASLDQSLLQDRPVAGRIAGRWEHDELLLEDLALQGDGIRVQGSGQLGQRIDFQLQVADLSRLGQNWQGQLAADGWLAHRSGQWVGAARGTLEHLELGQLQAGTGTFRFDYPGAAVTSELDISLGGVKLAQAALDALVIRGSGQIEEHQVKIQLVWPTGELTGELAGGWLAPDWGGRILSLSGQEATVGGWRLQEPAQLTVSREQLDLQELQLIGAQGGRLRLGGDLQFPSLAGSAEADWQELPMALLNPWLAEASLSGTASGSASFALRPERQLALTAELALAPVLQLKGNRLGFSDSLLRLSWNDGGLEAHGQLELEQGGRVELALTSAEAGRLRRPERGELAVSWIGVDVAQLEPWLPSELVLQGRWNGSFDGGWQPATPLRFRGRTWLESGGLQWQGDDGLIVLPLRQAELAGSWQDGWAEGSLAVALGDEGRIDGRFRLPAGAADPSARLEAQADFALQELGLLMLLMPGVTNETHGTLNGSLRLAGTWASPELFGTVALRDAGADVPNLGLRLRNFEFDATWDKHALTLERLQLQSGAGRLRGQGRLLLSGWRPQNWTLELQGENFELVKLPEMTLEATPDLQLSGTPGLLTVRGKLLIPTLLISEVPRERMIEPSEDVVLVGAAEETPDRVFEKLDVRVQVTLGKHVAVKAKGLDARLEGELVVATDQRGGFIGQGEIRVSQGHYAAYGLKLPISRGRAAFGGGDLRNPTLDVLAERTIGEVKAGVQVSGTPRRPVVKLVSDPSLPETEILSYIVLGRPQGATGGDQDNLMLAAGALLSQGESAALQEKLKRQFGFDTLEVQSGGEAGLTGSMVAIGKYLTPELYLSFGQSLFTQENVARLRYQLSKRWELESQFGTVSGADLSYRIEFR